MVAYLGTCPTLPKFHAKVDPAPRATRAQGQAGSQSPPLEFKWTSLNHDSFLASSETQPVGSGCGGERTAATHRWAPREPEVHASGRAPSHLSSQGVPVEQVGYRAPVLYFIVQMNLCALP
jgi:hypothetical protein